jgi:polysaccharide export outer membrane protein
LLQDVQAAGLTPAQLAGTIAEKLKKFLNEPKVTIIVTEINSRRVFVVGEVQRAGAYPLLPGMTVLQALSSAGGFTPYANMKRIHVLRLEGGKQIKLPFDYRKTLDGDTEVMTLQPGDTIVVP